MATFTSLPTSRLVLDGWWNYYVLRARYLLAIMSCTACTLITTLIIITITITIILIIIIIIIIIIYS